jgi:hypothetical protein
MTATDLQDVPWSELREFDFRAPGRDQWADVGTVQDRVETFLDGIPDSGWAVPVSASDAPGAPPWTLLDHLGHVADWTDEAIRCTEPLVDGTGAWPRDEDYPVGDFDAWNEGRRAIWEGRTPAEVRAWLRTSADRLVELARELPPGVADSDEAWEWVWHTLNAHPIEHVAIAAADGPSLELA